MCLTEVASTEGNNASVPKPPGRLVDICNLPEVDRLGRRFVSMCPPWYLHRANFPTWALFSLFLKLLYLFAFFFFFGDKVFLQSPGGPGTI